MGWALRALQHQIPFSTADIPRLLWGGTLQRPNLPTKEFVGKYLVHS